jgi:hypothetical protein
MPSDQPPSYQNAVGSSQAPALNVTEPSGETHRASSFPQPQQQHHGLERTTSNESFASDLSSDGGLGANIPEDGRRSMDDEMRDLPKGWVRCFDPKSANSY